jgi:hypothetical protein
LLSGPGWHLEPVFLQPEERRDVRAGCHLAPAWRLEPVFLQPEERRDVRAGCHLAPAWRLEPVTLQPGERRGGRAAWCQALASATVWAWLSGQQVSWPGELPVLRAKEWALRSGLASPPAQAVPQKVAWPQQAEVAEESDAPVLPRAVAESVSVRAAAGPLQEAAAVSVHVAAEPRPEAVSAPWVQAAAEEPDGSRAAAQAVAAASGVPVRQPAEARRADVAVQPPAAVRPVPWAQQVAAQQVAAALPGAQRAAVPSALPSEAASVFRQGPILAGPARPRAAARFAHAMRSLQIASRSERSWQAARNEGWSCGSTSPEGSLTKCWFEGRSLGLKSWFNEVLE